MAVPNWDSLVRVLEPLLGPVDNLVGSVTNRPGGRSLRELGTPKVRSLVLNQVTELDQPPTSLQVGSLDGTFERSRTEEAGGYLVIFSKMSVMSVHLFMVPWRIGGVR